MSQEPRKSEIKKKDIQRAVDGELNKSETAKLRAVIRQDAGVRKELEELKAVTETSQEVIQPVKPPANFKNKVLDGLKNLGKNITGK